MSTRSAAQALRSYQSKRNFSVTPEPREGGEASGERLRFVVQKHWASRLHYDFRLELDGTLKSWAIPKGPSLDPLVKRMAVEVEDHPVAYAGFEGTVPAGQYGAGKVIVWDGGEWQPLGDPHQGLHDGNLKFELQGHKLQGRWALVRMKAKGEREVPPAWLLIKERDAYARASAAYSVVDAAPDSVLLASSGGRGRLPPEAVATALPQAMAPALATLAAAPPVEDGAWTYEIKFDGYRLLLRVGPEGARLFTRNGHDWSAKLKALLKSVDALQLPPGWYDGEVVLPDEAGHPDFSALQQAFEAGRTADLVLYLFDLPHVWGHDLRAAPLEARRALLKSLLPGGPSADPAGGGAQRVRYSESFDADPRSLIASACRLGLEGVIGKRRGSRYASGRTADWIKLKCGQRQAFVVGGYTAPQGARAGVGALLLGVHDASGALAYAGRVGSGFSEQTLLQLQERLGRLGRKRSPFAGRTEVDAHARWVEPRLVAEVSFADWTRAGRIRHAVFRGLRNDKPATAIVRDLPQGPAEPGAPAEPALPVPSTPLLPGGLKVTHPGRVIDPASGTTKLDLVHYYAQVGPSMMAQLEGRPLSWVRAPGGVGGSLFFQKHTRTDRLPGVRQLDPAMLEITRAEGLVYAAQWNVVEFHTANRRDLALPDRPDRMVFDLDPGEGVPWTQVQEAAQLLRGFLSQLGLAAFLKTSGGKGLHLVTPLRRLHDWDTVKGFSQAVVDHVAKTIPQRFVARSGPRRRVGKVFIDYLRNGPSATTVCAWSARARPGMGISVPVDWDELPMLRGGDHWTVKTFHDRLETGNTPWHDQGKAARGLKAAMSALGYEPPSA